MRDMAESFGRELISARKFKGIALEQISDLTKIQLRYLEAMEAGHWDVLPQPYMEAFLKAYADVVGMNVPKVMKMFRDLRRQMLAIEAPEEELPAEPAPIQPPSPAPPRKSSAGWIISGLLILSAAAVALYFIFKPDISPRFASLNEAEEGVQKESPEPAAGGTATSDSTSVPDSISTSPDSAMIPADATSVPSDSGQHGETLPRTNIAPVEIPVGVNLLARARQRCWLRAILDKEDTQEALLVPGDSLVLRANNEVELLVGNAGGLELELDGESLGVLGPNGRAVTVVINPDGIMSQRLGRVNSLPDSAASP